MKNNKGFTMIELLVAMAISAMAMAAIYTAYNIQQKTFRQQNMISQMQQNARAAMFMLTRDVRMAGFGLASGQISYYDGSDTVTINAVTGTNSNPDSINIIYADSSCTTFITSAMPTPSSELNVDDTSCFAVDDLIVVSDGTNADIIQITTVQPVAKKIQHNPSSPVNSPSGMSNAYGAGALMYKLKWISYDIGSSDSAHPRLRVDTDGPLGGSSFQPFAENIEDLQIVYIFEDEDELNMYDDGTDADDTNDADDIRSVRVSVLARTDTIDINFSGNRPALEDHGAGSADKYRRRLLTSTIKIRNLGL